MAMFEASALSGFFLAFIIGIFLFPSFISWQKKHQVGQKIKKEGPNLHLHKENTPSMAGVVIMVSLILSYVLLKRGSMIETGGLILVISFFILGLLDDVLKNFFNLPWGLKARTKFGFQLLLSGFVMVWGINVFPLTFGLPFSEKVLEFSPVSFFFFGVFVIVASSNAFNITDGLDGLAGGCGTFSFLFWGWYFGQSNQISLSLLSFCGAGAIFAFLWYNTWPAKVFMGDAGSLSIGALFGFLALASGNSFLLVFCGLIFVIDTLSVIIQVLSCKLRKKRIFLMSPIHHHFELAGWKEAQITVRFWMIHGLGVFLAFFSLGR